MHQVVDNEIYIRISTNKQKRNQRKYRLSYTRCFGVCMYMRVRHFQKLQTSSLQSSSLVTLQKKKMKKHQISLCMWHGYQLFHAKAEELSAG